MDFNEFLGKRLLKYLDIEYVMHEDNIIVGVMTGPKTRDKFSYKSWRRFKDWERLLFGGTSDIENIVIWLKKEARDYRVKNIERVFEFSGGEELELQLSVRGF